SLAAIAMIALTVSLGNWQLRRADEKAAMQAVRDQAAAAGPIDFTGESGEPDGLVGSNVRITGHFDEDRTIFVDNRTYGGIAGFHVIAPMRIPGRDRVVMVLRGWVAGDPLDRRRLPVVPGGERAWTIEGLVEPGVPTGIRLGYWAPAGPEDRIWPRFELGTYAAWSGLEPYPWVLRQTGESGDGLVRDWIRPGDSTERHRAYALQWYSFALLFAGLWAWYGFWAPHRRRRAGRTSVDPPDQGRDRPSGTDAP
ncbi:MAG TPA: SURF1 family protein, partial [Thermomicrobiales bacterium]|nr:SURF1 family protein [Thermomicrobiales bacterium]